MSSMSNLFLCFGCFTPHTVLNFFFFRFFLVRSQCLYSRYIQLLIFLRFFPDFVFVLYSFIVQNGNICCYLSLAVCIKSYLLLEFSVNNMEREVVWEVAATAATTTKSLIYLLTLDFL